MRTTTNLTKAQMTLVKMRKKVSKKSDEYEDMLGDCEGRDAQTVLKEINRWYQNLLELPGGEYADDMWSLKDTSRLYTRSMGHLGKHSTAMPFSSTSCRDLFAAMEPTEIVNKRKSKDFTELSEISRSSGATIPNTLEILNPSPKNGWRDSDC